MSRSRLLILVLGPIPLIAGSILLSGWLRPRPDDPIEANDVVIRAEGPPAGDAPAQVSAPATVGGLEAGGGTLEGPVGASVEIDKACRQTSDRLAGELGEECGVIVRSPFVIGGDLSEDELVRWHEQTIGPAARAMAKSYFDIPPDEPITVLLLSGEQSYDRYAKRLFGDEGVSVYGYYKPNLRTLVMNIGTGGGTLVHELTHALIDFDFPAVPDWFNEGLASLHEQCRFRPGDTGIDGLVNWRLPGLQEAIQAGRLRPLESLIGDDDFRGRRVGVNYAQARYFCLFMQEKDLLEDYFRRFRANQADDPQGLATVQEIFPDHTWEELNAEFNDWAIALESER